MPGSSEGEEFSLLWVISVTSLDFLPLSKSKENHCTESSHWRSRNGTGLYQQTEKCSGESGPTHTLIWKISKSSGPLHQCHFPASRRERYVCSDASTMAIAAVASFKVRRLWTVSRQFHHGQGYAGTMCRCLSTWTGKTDLTSNCMCSHSTQTLESL